MSREDLINAIMAESHVSKTVADSMIKTVLEGIGNTLKSKGAVRLVGFGSFEKVHRPKKTGRNPRTGAALIVPATNQIKFKVGKQLKDKVNER